MKIYFPLMLILVLASCAQMQQAHNRDVAFRAIQDAKGCAHLVYLSDDAEPLRAVIPEDVTQANLEQISNDRKANPKEIAAIKKTDGEINKCRLNLLNSISLSFPAHAAIFVDSFNKTDERKIDLIKRKISWGKYISELKTISSDFDLKLSALEQNMAYQQQQTEYMRNQQTMQYLQYLQNAQQNQQLINTLNKPVFCNGHQMGAFYNTSCY